MDRDRGRGRANEGSEDDTRLHEAQRKAETVLIRPPDPTRGDPADFFMRGIDKMKKKLYTESRII